MNTRKPASFSKESEEVAVLLDGPADLRHNFGTKGAPRGHLPKVVLSGLHEVANGLSLVFSQFGQAFL